MDEEVAGAELSEEGEFVDAEVGGGGGGGGGEEEDAFTSVSKLASSLTNCSGSLLLSSCILVMSSYQMPILTS